VHVAKVKLVKQGHAHDASVEIKGRFGVFYPEHGLLEEEVFGRWVGRRLADTRERLHVGLGKF